MWSTTSKGSLQMKHVTCFNIEMGFPASIKTAFSSSVSMGEKQTSLGRLSLFHTYSLAEYLLPAEQ